MTVISKARASTANTALITLKGKGKAQREQAYMKIAPLSFVENLSRVETITNLRVALGASPSETEQATARNEWIIGRVASRLPAGEFPNGTADSIDKLEHARDLVLFYAAPVKEGTKARKLRASQKGRRSAVQQRVVRAAEEAWSQVKAELGHGAAQTQKERNAKKATRAPAMAGSTARGKGTTPEHSQLIKAPAPLTEADAVQHIVTQGASLLAFANKNAKLVPTDIGTAVRAFKRAIDKAASEFQLAKDKAIAEKAAKSK